jgi:hypothetical protein
LAAEIEQASALLRGKPAASQTWSEARQTVEPILSRAEEALRAGRRLLALQRLAAAEGNLAIASYLSERSAAESQSLAGLEAEWSRMGGVLRASLAAPSGTALDGVEPALLRALGEAALPQVRIYYDASVEYGRNTTPGSGLYYLASAEGQREVTALSRKLSAPTGRRAPPLRSLSAELAALESEMHAAYRPPAAIERHPEFIGASSTLKEARELDAAGLRYGALLRYLQAAQRFAALRPDLPAAPDATALGQRLAEQKARLAAGDVDHSLGQMFLELAEEALADAPAGLSPAPALAIAGDVLPRYFAALEPAKPLPPRLAPEVTVTHVRWPYT